MTFVNCERMVSSSYDIVDQKTRDALDALELGQENLGAPIDDENRIMVLNFLGPKVFTRLYITIKTDTIRVEREGGEPFGIADHFPDQYNPISVLHHTVGSLTLDRRGQDWAVRQHPGSPVIIKHPDSFGLFWRVLADHIQVARTKRALESQKAAS